MTTNPSRMSIPQTGQIAIPQINANAVRTGVTNSTVGALNKVNGLKDKLVNMGQGKLPMIILLVATVLIFIIVILYILFSIKSGKLAGKQLMNKPVKLDDISSSYEIAGAEMPKPVVGREYSYSFWIYLENYNQTFDKNGQGQMTPIDKLVFYRGSSGDVTSANPVVFMDGLSNKMYIAIKTQESSLYSGNLINYNSNLYNIRYMNYFWNSNLRIRDTVNPYQPHINQHLILTVDYIPLQRWVNVTFIVDNKICTVFVDGEIYAVKSTEEFKAIREPELDLRGRKIDVNVIVDKTDNNIYIGKNSVGGRNTVQGYMSKLKFYNYAISLREVKENYASGPLGKTKIGGFDFPYSLRSPVYRIDDTVQ